MIRIKILFLLLFFTLVQGFTQDLKEYYITCNPDSFQHIYTNYNQDIYIPITITHNDFTITSARMRIRGDGSRVFPKKSLKVKLDAGNFGDGISTFNFNADWEDKSYIQAYLQSWFFKQSGLYCFNVEHVRLYLNGDYLGLYISVQNMDEDFLLANDLSRYGNLYKASIDGSSMSYYDNIYYHWEKKNGTLGSQDLQELINMLDTVPDEDYYSFLNSNFDYEQLINFLAVSLLSRNYSTYYHNYFMFHDVFVSGKWIVLPWDLDKGFLYYGYNMPYYHTSRYWAPDNPIMEKVFFNNLVFSDLKDRIDSLYLSFINNSEASILIDSLHNVLYSSVLEDETDNITDSSIWLTQINNAKTAFNSRYNNLQQQFENYPTSFKVTRLKEHFLPSEPFLFNWTKSIIPSGEISGYSVFFGKNPDLDSYADTVIQNITDTFLLLQNNFEAGKYYYKVEANNSILDVEGFNNYNCLFVDSDSSDIIINEINYNSNSTFNPEDWIELYNNSSFAVDISGWIFSDENDEHIFIVPENTIIDTSGFLVLCMDYEKFVVVLPAVNSLIGSFVFGLSNDGEIIRLYNSIGRQKDFVHYNDQSPWPTEPDGSGSVLMLKAPDLDNSLAENWIASIGFGTPGQKNEEDSTEINPIVFSNFLCYPNPVTDLLNINYECRSNSTIEFLVTDITGKIILYETMYKTNAGKYYSSWQTKDLNSGIYLISYKENGILKSRTKLLKMR